LDMLEDEISEEPEIELIKPDGIELLFGGISAAILQLRQPSSLRGRCRRRRRMGWRGRCLP
jgi:hypothetical protein